MTPTIKLRWWCMAMAVLPLVFTSSYSTSLMTQMLVGILICLSYQVLLSQGGMLSFGHAIFTGAGSYAVIHGLNTHLFEMGATGWLWVIALPLLGGLTAAAVAAMLGWIATARSGTPFAMITLGLGELVWAAAWMFPDWSGGEAGLSADRTLTDPPLGMNFAQAWHLYALSAVYVLACAWAVVRFTQTPMGLMLRATRDRAVRVAFLGYNPHLIRYIAFIVSAFIAGIAGGLTALNFEFVSVDSFSLQRSGSAMLFTVVGGGALIGGSIIGGVLMVTASVVLSTFTPAWSAYVGLLFIWVVMRWPTGLSGMTPRDVLARANGWGLATAIGTIFLIEMTYHWVTAVAAGMPATLDILMVSVNVSQASHWSLAIAFTAVAYWLASRGRTASREGRS